MHQTSSEQHRMLLTAIAAAARRLPRPLRGPLRGAGPQSFLRAYYANVEAEETADRTPAELATIALSHLAFGLTRRGRALVRVFNPTLREHGYVAETTMWEDEWVTYGTPAERVKN